MTGDHERQVTDKEDILKRPTTRGLSRHLLVEQVSPLQRGGIAAGPHAHSRSRSSKAHRICDHLWDESSLEVQMTVNMNINSEVLITEAVCQTLGSWLNRVELVPNQRLRNSEPRDLQETRLQEGRECPDLLQPFPRVLQHCLTPVACWARVSE